MQCSYFDAGACRSCTEMGVPHADQLAAKDAACRALLGDHPGLRWLPPIAGPEAGFRNKAKMVVAGSVDAPTLGILDVEGQGVDLRRCGLYSPAMHALLPDLAALVTRAAVPPYDVRARRGELKHLLVTESPDGEFLVRFVLRSTEAVPRLRKHLPLLLEQRPEVRVVSVNLLPGHQALLEGDVEEVLTDERTLPLRLDDVTLRLGPRSFFQTNTAVGQALYRQVAGWVDELAPSVLWDLYCGVGGFALHCARPGRVVRGIEVSEEAVAAARVAAAALVDDAGEPLDVVFRAGDATSSAVGEGLGPPPDVVVVNPPRRGLGPELCAWLETSPAGHVVYSSCHAVTLARDLAALPSFEPVRAQLLDMFPQTRHYEVVTLLRRR